MRCKEFHTTPIGCCVDSKNLSKTLCATCLFFVLPLEVPGINTSAACDTALIGEIAQKMKLCLTLKYFRWVGTSRVSRDASLLHVAGQKSSGFCKFCTQAALQSHWHCTGSGSATVTGSLTRSATGTGSACH